MTVTLSASIAVAIADAPLRLKFTASTGNFVRVWCTAAPVGSRLRGKLNENKATRVHVADADSGDSFDYKFDKSGAYQLVATEITKGATPYGGGFQGAPDAELTETVLGDSALTFYVASSLKMPIGHGANIADLTLYVANDLIRETTLPVHGVASPAVAKPRSDKATTAAESSDLADMLAELIDTSATDALGDLSSIVTNIIDKFNVHIASGAYHDSADTENAVLAAFRNPTSPEALKLSVSAVLRSLSAHIRNDSVTTPSGTGTSAWHLVGTNRVDWAAIPLFESSATAADHVRAIADAWRAFEAHRASSAHDSPDNANTLTVLPKLLEVHRLFLAQIASLNPTVPITENSAKTILVHGAGFEES